MNRKLEEVIKSKSEEGRIESQWELVGMYRDDEGSHCACGKSIKNVFVIHNKKNGNEENVGSECVGYFGVDDDEVKTLEEVYKIVLKATKERVVSMKVLLALLMVGSVSAKTVEFMRSIIDTKRRTEKQEYWYEKIGKEVLDKCDKLLKDGIPSKNQ